MKIEINLKSSHIYRNACFLSFSSYKLGSFDFYIFFYTSIIFNCVSYTKNPLFMPLHLHIILIKSLKSIYLDDYPFLLIPISVYPAILYNLYNETWTLTLHIPPLHTPHTRHNPSPSFHFNPLSPSFSPLHPPPSSYHSQSTIFSFFMFITPPFLFILLLLTTFLLSHPPVPIPLDQTPILLPCPIQILWIYSLTPPSTPSNFFLPLHFFTNVPYSFSHTFHLILPPFHTTY